jgi:hypothetical protein
MWKIKIKRRSWIRKFKKKINLRNTRKVKIRTRIIKLINRILLRICQVTKLKYQN